MVAEVGVEPTVSGLWAQYWNRFTLPQQIKMVHPYSIELYSPMVHPWGIEPQPVAFQATEQTPVIREMHKLLPIPKFETVNIIFKIFT